ncbi:E3 ubiquitin-protein ligase RNF186-like [Tyto alba]|uniref:E3 ubiquitin-protein ligase RNF186-like n=1 Tax=Tyto alba TaxID=56313 RepID=UPI001C672820|nr:E3 ubiquitin-protein ligase RNF186-like [Tyto alba]
MAGGPEAGQECGICYEAYWGAGGGRAPQQLSCRHSLCLSCLRKLVCRAAAVAFVTCPFCRTVTLVPELARGGPRATPASGTPPGEEEEEQEEEEEEEEGSGASPDTRQASARSVAAEVAFAAHAPVFAVSGMVSPCGLRRGSEAPGAFVLGLPGRGLLLDTQPPLASMENLRLGFAAGILVLIVSTFFLLVFLK